jgi:hypothetical protein
VTYEHSELSYLLVSFGFVRVVQHYFSGLKSYFQKYIIAFLGILKLRRKYIRIKLISYFDFGGSRKHSYSLMEFCCEYETPEMLSLRHTFVDVKAFREFHIHSKTP